MRSRVQGRAGREEGFVISKFGAIVGQEHGESWKGISVEKRSKENDNGRVGEVGPLITRGSG